MPTAGILVIGNEILSGKVVDANSPYLCRELRALGVEVWVFIANAIAASGNYATWLGQTGSPLHYLVPVAAGAMIVRLVHSAETAALFAIIVAIITGLQLDGRVSFAVYTLAGSLFAAASAERVTQRSTLLRAGVKVGLANVAVIAAISLLGDQAASGTTLVALVAGFLSGCLVGGFVVADSSSHGNEF